MADYVASPPRPSAFHHDPRSLYYYLNKATRSLPLRTLCGQLVRLCIPRAQAAAPAEAEITRLKADGLLFWEQLLEPERLDRIIRYLKGRPVYDTYDKEAQHPLSLEEEKKSGGYRKLRYAMADLLQCEDLVRLANDGRILSLVSAYLGCRPTITFMEAWWTIAPDAPSGLLFQDDMYHRDVEDFRFIKLFVYLTDVHAGNGAHAYIRGSHASPQLTARGSISDEAASSAFAAPDRLVLTGKAGAGFLEDTWGIHRATPAREGERLIFSVFYCMTSLNPQSPRRPLSDNRYKVDPYINRVLLA